jgi:Domain of unknown function (DUF4350)
VSRAVRGYALAVMAVLLTLTVLVLGTAPPAQNDDPSSRVAGKAGTLALYEWLGALGYNVHRISGSFDVAGTDVLLIVDPRTVISDADAAAIMGALGRGSDVVLAVSPESHDQSVALLDRLHVSLSALRAAGDSLPVQPFDAGQRVHHVPMAAGYAIAPGPQLTPLLGQGDAVTAVAEQVGGGGRAYVLASAFPFSNDGLRDADSATLVLALLERAHGGAIGFDEYHHGEITPPLDGALAVFGSPLGLALLLALATVLGFLALSGRRLGRPLPASDPAVVPTTAAYIGAMAGLYARSRDRGAVASRYAEELKQRLCAGGGAQPGPAGDAAVVERVRTARPELGDEVASLLARARSLAAMAPDAASLLALARDVDDMERRWEQPWVPAAAQWRE